MTRINLYICLNFFQSALELYERLYQKEHDSMARALTNLAFYYLSIGNFYESGSYFKKAHLINLNLYKSSHFKIALSLKNLGIFYMKSSQFEESLKHFKLALEMNNQFVFSMFLNIAQSKHKSRAYENQNIRKFLKQAFPLYYVYIYI